MIKDSNIRYSGVTTKEIYDIISKVAYEQGISVSKFISQTLEKEAELISGKELSSQTRQYKTNVKLV